MKYTISALLLENVLEHLEKRGTDECIETYVGVCTRVHSNSLEMFRPPRRARDPSIHSRLENVHLLPEETTLGALLIFN